MKSSTFVKKITVSERLIKQLDDKINHNEIVSLINNDKSVLEFYAIYYKKGNELSIWRLLSKNIIRRN